MPKSQRAILTILVPKVTHARQNFYESVTEGDRLLDEPRQPL
jgi:hypothetical protein